MALVIDMVLEGCITFSGPGHILKAVFVEQISANTFLMTRARCKRASVELPLQSILKLFSSSLRASLRW